MKGQHHTQVFWLLLATLFISTSGALGKFIAMPTPVTIWWRSALAGVFLLIYCLIKGISLKLNEPKDRWPFFLSAFFMGAHWVTYFYSLQISNVAIGMLSLFTFPIITSVLEPAFTKTKFDPFYLPLGALILFGVYLLAPEFSLENDDFKGILLGLLSALCYALRTLILKQHVSNYNGTALMFFQVLILSVLLLPALFFMDSSGIVIQYPYILILALLTTAIGHTMFVSSLRYFKVTTASIIASAQPIFGIIIAFLFLNEIPATNTYIGGAIILTTVLIESLRSRKV
ncbi:EamA family transporter [Winogradskyella maritima]|uniref:DMT family transporter n=1 Tax=Winogradskyella maritima TaxID=1517766 RepID=A0ABV8AG44_9FLAO|nr:EamA family transporter [Winogradskyella maritima]